MTYGQLGIWCQQQLLDHTMLASTLHPFSREAGLVRICSVEPTGLAFLLMCVVATIAARVCHNLILSSPRTLRIPLPFHFL